MEVMIRSMDNSSKSAETVYRDMRAAIRHFPSGMPVRAIGYLPVKRDRVQRSFQRLVFMFILDGEGDLIAGGRTWPVKSPCVMLGFPDAYLDYGPAVKWEELYINYLTEHLPAVKARGLIPADKLVWQIHEPAAIRRRVRELLDTLRNVVGFGQADRIDRLCEGLIMDSLISDASPPLGPKEHAVQAVRGHIEQHYRKGLDFDRLAREHGLSPSDFRRRWATMMRTAPGQFVTHLRIQEACRLLNESGKTVAEVAAAVGYDDPLYFSRRFRQIVGEPATSYRGRGDR